MTNIAIINEWVIGLFLHLNVQSMLTANSTYLSQ